MSHQISRMTLEEIKKTDSHPTADELYQRVRQRLPHVSLGTIYRNLETLAASGLIQKLEIGGSQKRFDGDLAAHHHVRCTACGHVTDVHIGPADGINYSILDARGYDITGHRVEFIGLCPECRENTK